MAREQIQYPRIERIELGGIDADGTSRSSVELRESTAPVLHIGWHGDGQVEGWVQVSLEVTRKWLDEMVQSYSDTDDQRIHLHSEVMTRPEINKAIQVLRRARDKAYGSDA